jgi:hypothetical protein
MNKDTDNMTTDITPGKPVKVEASSRKEAGEKIAEIRKEAAKQGLSEKEGGFISATEDGTFIAELNFIKTD